MQPRVLAASLVIAVLAAACGPSPATPAPSAEAITEAPSAPGESATLVGISLPASGTRRWDVDGELVRSALEDMGYRVTVEHADDPAGQVEQVEELIDAGAGALLIAPVDSRALADVLERAASEDVRVLAYDRLIRDTPNVDYFVSFDRFGAGELVGTAIEQALDLKAGGDPRTLELIAGAPEDEGQEAIVAGAFSVLQPYLDIGSVVVPSGRTEFPADIATLPADEPTAQARVAELLAASDEGTRLDILLSTADVLSRGAIAALKDAGYYTSDLPGPVGTGVGAELPSVQSILAGEQTSTVFQDPRALARQAATMLDQMIRRQTVDVNDAGTVDNGAKVVPTFLQDSVSVTAENVEAELVESGYYTDDAVRP